MRLVATNLAVCRREDDLTNVCAQRALCLADNLSFKRNALSLDANIVTGSMTRWRLESLPYSPPPAPSQRKFKERMASNWRRQ